MIRMLLPVDDSAESRHSVDVFLKKLDCYREKPELHLLNVQPPLRGDISSFLKAELIEQYHRDEGMKAIEPMRQRLEAAGFVPKVHVVVGHVAETIVRFATELDCDQIVMGSRGLGSAGSWFLGSTVTRVLHQSRVPVLVMR
jgi:nucleotide-binding universal stress UspA family protein